MKIDVFAKIPLKVELKDGTTKSIAYKKKFELDIKEYSDEEIDVALKYKGKNNYSYNKTSEAYNKIIYTNGENLYGEDEGANVYNHYKDITSDEVCRIISKMSGVSCSVDEKEIDLNVFLDKIGAEILQDNTKKIERRLLKSIEKDFILMKDKILVKMKNQPGWTVNKIGNRASIRFNLNAGGQDELYAYPLNKLEEAEHKALILASNDIDSVNKIKDFDLVIERPEFFNKFLEDDINIEQVEIKYMLSDVVSGLYYNLMGNSEPSDDLAVMYAKSQRLLTKINNKNAKPEYFNEAFKILNEVYNNFQEEVKDRTFIFEFPDFTVRMFDKKLEETSESALKI